MAYFLCKGRQFKAYITVQTNPSVYVGATIGDKTFAGTADANGVVTIEVRKKGTYTVANSNGTSTTVAVLKYKQTYTCDCVTVGTPTGAVATWSSLTACAYWTWGNYHSGMKVYRDNSEIYSGNGNSLNLTNTNTVTGITNGSLSSGTTYAYKFKQFYTINGRTFYSAETSVINYTAVSISGSKGFTSTQNWTVPTGVRSISVGVVGAGGGGGAGVAPYNYVDTYNAGGGGAGGKVAYQNSISVVPGIVLSVSIGSGSTAATGGTTKVTGTGVSVSASGGGAGGTSTGGSGGTGGGSGGAYNSSTGSKSLGNGGTNGGNGSGYDPGSGDGKTKYLFGDTRSTLYCGGGGGGGARGSGSGGNRGGGNGGYGRDAQRPTNGTANSGGGGGGCGARGDRNATWWSGSGSSGGSGYALIKY